MLFVVSQFCHNRLLYSCLFDRFQPPETGKGSFDFGLLGHFGALNRASSHKLPFGDGRVSRRGTDPWYGHVFCAFCSTLLFDSNRLLAFRTKMTHLSSTTWKIWASTLKSPTVVLFQLAVLRFLKDRLLDITRIASFFGCDFAESPSPRVQLLQELLCQLAPTFTKLNCEPGYV